MQLEMIIKIPKIMYYFIKRNFMNLYSIPTVRERICRVRFFVLRYIHKIDLLNSKKALHWQYSQNQFGSYSSNKLRINYLVNLVSSIAGNRNSEKIILSCGPRYESELFGFRSLGFKWKNIYAIDIFTYSPKIKLGDIHSINFSQNKFDLIVCGWIIAYSADPEVAIQQLQRVVKTGGKVILSWELPTNYKVSDNLNLRLHRKSDINDDTSVLNDTLILPIVSKYFKVTRIEIGKLHFNKDVPFALLVLEK